jgi:hypothetical protein
MEDQGKRKGRRGTSEERTKWGEGEWVWAECLPYGRLWLPETGGDDGDCGAGKNGVGEGWRQFGVGVEVLGKEEKKWSGRITRVGRTKRQENAQSGGRKEGTGEWEQRTKDRGREGRGRRRGKRQGTGESVD